MLQQIGEISGQTIYTVSKYFLQIAWPIDPVNLNTAGGNTGYSPVIVQKSPITILYSL